jgi:hypothetical protein
MSAIPFPPSIRQTEVTINGTQFSLPLSGEINLPLEDGTNLILSPNSVQSGSHLFNIPSSNNPIDVQATDGSGATIKAQPVATKSTDRKKGCSGLGCLFSALGSIAKDAVGAASDLTSLAEKGTSWAAGEISDSDLPGVVGGLIGSVGSSKLDLTLRLHLLLNFTILHMIFSNTVANFN